MLVLGGDLERWTYFPECPDCCGRDWHFGPRGGLSINLQCLGCRAWFNVVLAGIENLIQRIDGRPPDGQNR